MILAYAALFFGGAQLADYMGGIACGSGACCRMCFL